MGKKEECSPQEFWNRIEQLRDAKGWNENELCRQAEIPQPTLNNSRSRGNLPHLDNCIALARALDTTLEYLAFGDETMKNRQAVYAERHPDLVNAGPHEGTVSLALVIPRIVARIGEILQEELLGKKPKDPPEGSGTGEEGLSPKEKAPIIRRYKREVRKQEEDNGRNEGSDSSSQAIG